MKKPLTILGILMLLSLLLIGIVSWLVKQPMPWYSPPLATDSEISTIANTAELRFNEEFHKIRPQEETWKLRIKDPTINAWLTTRLEGWLTHDDTIEIPAQFSSPFIWTTPEGVWIAGIVLLEDAASQPIAVQLDISFEQNETITFTPIAIRLGRIPLPIAMFESTLDDFGTNLIQISAAVPLMDDRFVEVKSVTLEDGAIVLTCQTNLP